LRFQWARENLRYCSTRRVGKGALLGVAAWAKSCARRAHA